MPLLKLTDRKDNMEADRAVAFSMGALPLATARLQVDFCINNELGVRNSLLLNTYLALPASVTVAFAKDAVKGGLPRFLPSSEVLQVRPPCPPARPLGKEVGKEA